MDCRGGGVCIPLVRLLTSSAFAAAANGTPAGNFSASDFGTATPAAKPGYPQAMQAKVPVYTYRDGQ
ncbi:hypothetical protein Trydic_g13014 [Trypoxylus dichotomus]